MYTHCTCACMFSYVICYFRFCVLLPTTILKYSLHVKRYTCSHIPQRIANHTRSGGPKELNLLCFKEAYDDTTTGLTRAALTGERKQSVVDAERLFGPNVAEFMRKRGYHYELKYVETIWNWRRACDQRGLSELERCRFNYKFLNLILDDLMPWHKDCYDFSLLEVNRYAL